MHLHTSSLPSTCQTHSVKNQELNGDHKPVVNYISGAYPYILFSLLPVVVQDGWVECNRTMEHLAKINIELLIHVKNSPSVPITSFSVSQHYGQDDSTILITIIIIIIKLQLKHCGKWIYIFIK